MKIRTIHDFFHKKEVEAYKLIRQFQEQGKLCALIYTKGSHLDHLALSCKVNLNELLMVEQDESQNHIKVFKELRASGEVGLIVYLKKGNYLFWKKV